MKRVLMITYYWPPAGGPGAQRIVKFARYLPEFGWEPIVVTVNGGEFPFRDTSLEADVPAGTQIHRTRRWEPFGLYKRLTGRKEGSALPVGLLGLEKRGLWEKFAAWIRANVFIPDARIGWIPFAARKGAEIVRQGQVDLVFTSSPPHSLQLAGWLLKRRTGLPWVADLRDPWTEIRHYQSIERAWWAEGLDRFWERQVLRAASHVTAPGPALAAHFQGKLGEGVSSRFSVLTNGYDEADFESSLASDTPFFEILHTGNLLASQNPLPLWQSLRQMVLRKPEFKQCIRVRFIGRVDESALMSARNFGLMELVETQDFVPHDEAVARMKGAAVLLAVVPQIANNEGIITAKVPEYIGSGRPILLVGPPDGDAGQIVSRFANSVACDYADVVRCSSFIETTYEAWKRRAVPESPACQRAPFSRRALAAQLASIFDRVSDAEQT